ncbi:hypothetical protein FPZ12_035210 [Amycolatopsis acidicola]|uniref:FAD-binding FR-type domain-containing protein n=1 Tax=Amycolatopsis acidicola TaxID=2596893 RepID=A0A5N0UQD5_9PSEU|nr:MSMEG_1061 family FMN-dependent PPOX-type flavoprotein [Amycolatopsis acidicola]KAA9153170.1 hypothetical protein FPZ12_035210 [Amycolatopsis acidicola]
MPTAVCYATVLAARRVTPGMLRLTFGGPEVSGLTSGGYDQRVKLFIPPAGQLVPRLPLGEDWYGEYRAMPVEARPILRTYTIRAHRPEAGEFDIDFAAHGHDGPATDWARRARPGDILGIVAPAKGTVAPAGVEYRPGEADWQLFVGDETALPAIGSIIEALPERAKALAFLDVASPSDTQRFTTAGDVQVRWLPRSARGSTTLEALRATEFPAGRPYGWVAGEAKLARAVHRQLTERGWRDDWIYCAGYWKGSPVTEVASEAELRTIVEPPHEAIAEKSISYVDPVSAEFLARSTFFLLATGGEDGALDLSPRGDPAGSIVVLDEGRGIAIADRRGNRRLDSMRNILRDPGVAMLFIVPGIEHALRINGRARIVREESLLARLADRGKPPELALVVDIDELFVHCGQALKRSALWEPSRWPRGPVPTAGELFKSHTGLG